MKKDNQHFFIFTITILTFLFVFFNSYGGFVAAENSQIPQVSLIPANTQPTMGDIVEFEVQLKDFVPPNDQISTFEVKLSYDTQYFEKTTQNVILGDIFTDIPSSDYQIVVNNIDQGNGLIHFAVSLYKQTTPFTGNGTLFSFSLNTIQTGRSELEITKSIMVQEGRPGINVTHTTESAGISINDPNSTIITPQPSEKPEPVGNIVPSPPAQNGESEVVIFNDQAVIEKLFWATSSINRLAQLQIFSGDENRNFHPNQPMSREEFAKVIVLLMQLRSSLSIEKEAINEQIIEAPKDINQGRWSAAFIREVMKEKLMQGSMEDGVLRFDPERKITRAEIATTIVKLMGISVNQTTDIQAPFKDIDKHWASNFIKIAYSTGIIRGKSETVFDPESPATRAEVAVMLVRYLDYKSSKQ